MMNYDVLIIGAGFSGAVVARQLAEKYNQKVYLIEKRNHIAGNMYESESSNGVRTHLYGPHIFHTNDESVFEYLKRFSEFYEYEHCVVGKIDGNLVPIPFNFQSIDKLFDSDKADRIKSKLTEEYPSIQKVSILDLLNSKDELIREFGAYVYEKVFVHYTAKQWQQPIEDVDTSVINRVPVVLGYDNRYFQDDYQHMPRHGYTKLFEKLLNHPNITVQLGTDAASVLSLDISNGTVHFLGAEWNKPIVFTGAIDELFFYEYGHLPYRSLNLVFEDYNQNTYQANSVVNYPNEEEFTRITEFKFLTSQDIRGVTTILKEYPCQYNPNGSVGNIPFYPIINNENIELYKKYADLSRRFKMLYLCGRLAEYKYYNMDSAISSALKLSDEIGRTLI